MREIENVQIFKISEILLSFTSCVNSEVLELFDSTHEAKLNKLWRTSEGSAVAAARTAASTSSGAWVSDWLAH